MNWFDIIKVLGTKSGYAQLDFDNIVEEEDDNCRKRWLQLREKVENWAKENCSEFTAKKFNRVSYDRDGLNDFKQTVFVKGKSHIFDKWGMHIAEMEEKPLLVFTFLRINQNSLLIQKLLKRLDKNLRVFYNELV